MRKIGKHLLIFSLSFSFVLSGVNAFGATKAELQKELDAVNAQRRETQSNLNNLREQERITIEEIDAIDKEMAEISASLDVITKSLEEKRVELTTVEGELEEAEKARDIQYEAFKKRSRYIYMNGSMGYIDVIFNADSVTDLIKRIDYVNRIVEYDKGLVTSLKESEELISAKLTQTQKQKDDLEVMELFETQEMHKYEQTRAQKESVIEMLSKDQVEYLRHLEQQDASSKELEKQIKAFEEEERRKALAAQYNQSANTVSVYTYDGNPMQWPLPGWTRISSPYGYRTSPISGKNEFHDGVDIPASYGTQVLAAESGTVITAGWVNGYGNTVVISHGSSISTLYGHNSSLLVSKGQTVSRGQVIARVGSTGWSTGNHVHFQVRQSGSVQNPMNYTNAR